MVFRDDNIWPALKDLSHRAEDGSQQQAGNTLHFDISFFFTPSLAIGTVFHAPGVPQSVIA